MGRNRAVIVTLSRIALVPVFLIAVAADATAETALGQARCDLTEGETAMVAAVPGALTVTLATGMIVRLAGLVVPDEAAAESLAVLQALALGETVTLRYGDVTRDRYDRATAQIFLAGDDGVWLQERLLAEGLAIVSGRPDDRQCLSDLLAAEATGRSAAAGLWQNYNIPDAWSDTIRTEGGRFTLIEGRVVSIGRTASTIYLNFGNDWARDLTVTIGLPDAAIIEDEGDSLDILVGQVIRVRGWLTQRDGPWIRVDHPEQIELLSAGNAADD